VPRGISRISAAGNSAKRPYGQKVGDDQRHRDPVSCEVNGRRYHFYCRLFPDEDAAREVYRDLAIAAMGSNASAFLIRELEEQMTWGIIFFSEERLEILALSPFIHDYGRPYRSRFLADAVRHRQGVLASRALGGGHTFPAGVLGSLDPRKIL